MAEKGLGEFWGWTLKVWGGFCSVLVGLRLVLMCSRGVTLLSALIHLDFPAMGAMPKKPGEQLCILTGPQNARMGWKGLIWSYFSNYNCTLIKLLIYRGTLYYQ